MEDIAMTFEALRSRLHGIAYRMLGSVAEAEDVVQDAWLRWHDAERASIANAEAWLVSVTTRIAIDRLRAEKIRREHYAGIWLPEPLIEDAATPEALKERADDISLAFLALLERLSPEARAAFLLREVFDADYRDVAEVLDRSEAACRQLVSRARTQLRDTRPRFAVSPQAHRKLLLTFAQAMQHGDFTVLSTLLADDAELIGDGGGHVPSFPKPLVGGRRIAQLFYAGFLRHGDGMRVELTVLNRQWAILRFVDGTLESAQFVDTDGQRIQRILVQRNPLKLARLAQRG